MTYEIFEECLPYPLYPLPRTQTTQIPNQVATAVLAVAVLSRAPFVPLAPAPFSPCFSKYSIFSSSVPPTTPPAPLFPARCSSRIFASSKLLPGFVCQGCGPPFWNKISISSRVLPAVSGYETNACAAAPRQRTPKIIKSFQEMLLKAGGMKNPIAKLKSLPILC
jgi:hypothetical protein